MLAHGPVPGSYVLEMQRPEKGKAVVTAYDLNLALIPCSCRFGEALPYEDRLPDFR